MPKKSSKKKTSKKKIKSKSKKKENKNSKENKSEIKLEESKLEESLENKKEIKPPEFDFSSSSFFKINPEIKAPVLERINRNPSESTLTNLNFSSREDSEKEEGNSSGIIDYAQASRDNLRNYESNQESSDKRNAWEPTIVNPERINLIKERDNRFRDKIPFNTELDEIRSGGERKYDDYVKEIDKSERDFGKLPFETDKRKYKEIR